MHGRASSSDGRCYLTLTKCSDAAQETFPGGCALFCALQNLLSKDSRGAAEVMTGSRPCTGVSTGGEPQGWHPWIPAASNGFLPFPVLQELLEHSTQRYEVFICELFSGKSLFTLLLEDRFIPLPFSTVLARVELIVDIFFHRWIVYC